MLGGQNGAAGAGDERRNSPQGVGMIAIRRAACILTMLFPVLGCSQPDTNRGQGSRFVPAEESLPPPLNPRKKAP